MNDSKVIQIPQIITSAFAALGSTEPIAETIMLCNKCYAGRKFFAGGFVALWLVEKNIVKIFDQEKRLVCSINPDETLKKAA